MTVALAIEATGVISFGAAPYYVPFVLLPLVLTRVLAGRADARQKTSAPRAA